MGTAYQGEVVMSAVVPTSWTSPIPVERKGAGERPTATLAARRLDSTSSEGR